MSDNTLENMQNTTEQIKEVFGNGTEMHYRYLTKSDLRRLNNQAIKNNLNRSLKPKFVDGVQDKFSNGTEIKYPITNKLLHNDKEMRCWFNVLVNEEFFEVFLDISLVEFNALPTVEMQPLLNS